MMLFWKIHNSGLKAVEKFDSLLLMDFSNELLIELKDKIEGIGNANKQVTILKLNHYDTSY